VAYRWFVGLFGMIIGQLFADFYKISCLSRFGNSGYATEHTCRLHVIDIAP